MYYVGIDIAKSFHVVTIIDENEVKVTQKPIRVTNCIDGFSKFITKLETISSNTNDFIIGLEATGIYGENLWEFLNSHGFNVKLLNPFQTTRYREQHPELLRSRTLLRNSSGSRGRAGRRRRRSEEHGSVLARSGNRSHSRRRLQPHVRSGD